MRASPRKAATRNWSGVVRSLGRAAASDELSANLRLLEAGEWHTLHEALALLRRPATPDLERAVANYLDDNFAGLGPKQSRNVLQALGLTRYEIPLDSRVTRWLRDASFPVPVGATALSDRAYYCFVLDIVQQLCEATGVFPCELDGAVFAASDSAAWTPALVRF